MKRRSFIRNNALAIGSLILPWQGLAKTKSKGVRFGLIADVHQDIIHDADLRLQQFINHSKKEQVDFIMQLGDFCHPLEENRGFMDIWEHFDGEKYHVLGNHDMDLGTKTEAMAFWDMAKNYYSFDKDGIHFVVLDANYIKKKGATAFTDYANANFYISYDERPYIDDEQLEWIREDLSKTKNPTFIFSHQSLENEKWGVVNRGEVMQLLTDINREAGQMKVVACFNGHHHVDYYYEYEGIHMLMINSSSYYWVGEDYAYTRFDDEIERRRPLLSKVIPYKKPIYAMVSILAEGKLIIRGSSTKFVKPGPDELGFPAQPLWNQATPKISNF